MVVSVLEHLWEPLETLARSGGYVSPRGVVHPERARVARQEYLELSAFRLGLSPASEMDDHKTYYDVADLWPLLVRAGFMPSQIRCFSHKFGLNTFAVCRVPISAKCKPWLKTRAPTTGIVIGASTLRPTR